MSTLMTLWLLSPDCWSWSDISATFGLSGVTLTWVWVTRCNDWGVCSRCCCLTLIQTVYLLLRMSREHREIQDKTLILIQWNLDKITTLKIHILLISSFKKLSRPHLLFFILVTFSQSSLTLFLFVNAMDNFKMLLSLIEFYFINSLILFCFFNHRDII